MNSIPYFEGTESLRGKSDLEALLSLDDMSLFKVAGEDHSRAALVTVMLHGNEPCGFRAMLREINANRKYPFDLYWLVGNVKAAQIEPPFTNRVVPGGQNYNRIWVAKPTTEAERQALEVFEYFRDKSVVGMLDIHSFTPKDTPQHCFIGDQSEQNVRLTRRIVTPYAHTFVIDNPMGTIAERFALYIPSISVECGTNGTQEADDYAYDALQRFFVEIGVLPGQNNDVPQGLYLNMTNLKLLPDVRPVWAAERDPHADITIRPDVGKLNVREQPTGTFYAYASRLDGLYAIRQGGRELSSEQVFDFREGKLYFRRNFVPNLMSPVERIQKESGFYLFTRLNA